MMRQGDRGCGVPCHVRNLVRLTSSPFLIFAHSFLLLRRFRKPFQCSKVELGSVFKFNSTSNQFFIPNLRRLKLRPVLKWPTFCVRHNLAQVNLATLHDFPHLPFNVKVCPGLPASILSAASGLFSATVRRSVVIRCSLAQLSAACCR